MRDKTVYYVHCVDTEGPLYESLTATFERVKNVFGIDMPASKENLEKLRRGDGIEKPLQKLVKEFVSPDRLNYNESWADIDRMLDEIMSPEWRNQYKDDFGNGYIFNWFCLDHVGFTVNPRRRALGYHVVFEHYKQKLIDTASKQDEIQWHFHPVPFFREANKTSNTFANSNEHIQVFCRRIIDHLWFPSAYRPGSHCERPDINLFLEQWIPFDFGNQAVDADKNVETDQQKDLGAGRFGDWRRATPEWEVYHPDFYDYQIPGDMKRFIARCLNLNARIRMLDENEIEKAFRRADSGYPTIMAVTDHDERNMQQYIDINYKLIKQVQKRYPGVKIKHARANQAFREALNLTDESPVNFDISWTENTMSICSDRKVWGCQPFFCFLTKGKQYFHENMDYHGGTHWSFTFDDETVNPDQIEWIGIAANNSIGNSTVTRFKPYESDPVQHQIIR